MQSLRDRELPPGTSAQKDGKPEQACASETEPFTGVPTIKT
jgi:hypothetical protein